MVHKNLYIIFLILFFLISYQSIIPETKNNIIVIQKIDLYKIHPNNIYLFKIRGKYTIGVLGKSGDIIYLGYKRGNTISWKKILSVNQGFEDRSFDIEINEDLYIKGSGYVCFADYYSPGQINYNLEGYIPKGNHGIFMRATLSTKYKYKIFLISDKKSIKNVKIYYFNYKNASISTIKFEITEPDYWETDWLPLFGSIEYIKLDLANNSYILFNIQQKKDRGEFNFSGAFLHQILSSENILILIIIFALIFSYIFKSRKIIRK